MQRIKRYALNIIISLAVILLMLLLFELFLNLFPLYSFYYGYPTGLFQNAAPPLDFVLTPHFEGRMKSGEYNVGVSINSRGLRDYEHTLSKGNKTRILALGDSFTFGNGVEQDETFLRVIETKLDVEVINAGVPAYGQDNQLEYYKEEGYKYNPDIVAIFYYMNDNDDNIGTSDRKIVHGTMIEKKSYEHLHAWKLFLYSKLYQIKTLRLIKRVSPIYADAFNKNIKGSYVEKKLFLKNQSIHSKDWEQTRLLFHQFREVLPETTYLIIIYVPSAQQLQSTGQYFNLDLEDRDQPNKILHEIASEINVPFIDVTSDFRNANLSDITFKYDSHYNKYGHRAYGLLVAHELNKVISLPDTFR